VDLGAGQGDVWVPLQDERLLRIDEGSGTISATSPLPAAGYSPVVAAAALWLIVATDTPQVSKIDPGNVTQTAATPFPAGFLTALASGEGAVWAVDHLSSQLWRIDTATAQARHVVRVGHHPISVAAGYGATWVGVQGRRFR
jgi:hypothetical protein